MLVKELYLRDLMTNEPVLLENLEVEDATEFKGFLRVKFLGSAKEPGKDNIAFFNRDVVIKILPELLK